MTTIAYHENIIAVDSRATTNGVITDDNSNKIIKKNGVVFIVSGALSDFDEIVKAYNGEPYDKNADASAFVDDGGTVYLAGICKDDGFWKLDITDRSYAIGSGADHAWTALDLECNAVEAVKMAIKRNIYTGGKIRTHKVKGEN